MSGLHPVLLCIVSTVSATSTPPRQYTFNINRLTWNEAKAVCANNLAMLAKIDTPSSDAAVKRIVSHLSEQNVISTDMWIGLFDTNPPQIQYGWTDCAELGAWTKWYPGEPNDQLVDYCVRYTRTGLWRTGRCDLRYHCICERQLDRCWFDKVTGARLAYMYNSTVLANSTFNTCRSVCLNQNETEGECIAVTSYQDGRCVMTLGNKPYVFDTPNLESDDEATTSIKRCVDYYVSDFTIDHVDTSSVPNNTCVPSSPALPTAHRGTSIALPDCTKTGTSDINDGSDTDSSAVSDLVLDKTTLSSYRRRLTSVYDGRPTAVALGSVGVALLCTTICIIVCSDFGKLIKSAQQVIHGGSKRVNKVRPKAAKGKRT